MIKNPFPVAIETIEKRTLDDDSINFRKIVIYTAVEERPVQLYSIYPSATGSGAIIVSTKEKDILWPNYTKEPLNIDTIALELIDMFKRGYLIFNIKNNQRIYTPYMNLIRKEITYSQAKKLLRFEYKDSIRSDSPRLNPASYSGKDFIHIPFAKYRIDIFHTRGGRRHYSYATFDKTVPYWIDKIIN